MSDALNARAVLQNLLDTMHATVLDYHPSVLRPATACDEVIQGTAFFPGGSGLWRGDSLHGTLPESFPSSPLMVVAHNFDSIDSYNRSMARGGEVDSLFWSILIAILRESNTALEDVFYTNALMGFKPGSAVGNMPAAGGYEEQCAAFLKQQIEIVRPRAIVALGEKAETRLRRIGVRAQRVLHPSAREFKPLASRAALIKRQADALRRGICEAQR